MRVKKRMTKLLAALSAGVLLASAFTACGSSSGSQSTTKDTVSADTSADVGSADTTGGVYGDTVTISFTTWIGYAPLFIAKEKGIFEKNGVDVELRVIESAGDIKAAIAAGAIQGYAQTIDTIVMGIGAGLDSTQVLVLDTSDGGDGIICKNEYATIEDLKGQKVALDTSGGASLFYFNYVIGQLGLTMNDFDIQNMSAGDAGSAFVGGSVDAAVTWEPWLTNAKQTDFGKVIRSSSEDPGVICDTLCFTTDFVNSYPDTVQAICDSWFEALDMLDADETHDECIKIMADSQGMTVDELNDTLPCVTYYDRDMNKDYLGGGGLQEMSEYAAKVWLDIGLVDSEVDCSKCVDKRFVAAE
ncbi:MAG: ABC transporter substrate-binding protein [Huintestinicola sp.]